VDEGGIAVASKRRPAVTVIIVSYRSAGLTIECLRSLLPERTSEAFTLKAVVVDNDSGDATAIGEAIDCEDWASWVRLIRAPKNGGFAYGNNLGINLALKHDDPHYLHLLNPDTLAKPDAVSALVTFLEGHPDVGIAGSRFENADGSDWPIAFRFPSILSEIEGGLRTRFVTRLLRSWSVAKIMSHEAQPIDWGAGASMMIRRSVLDGIGVLDESFFLYFEETEFCWRARQAGFPFWYVPQSRVTHIAGQSTKVTERDAKPQRLPPYWFESRRRYYLATRGLMRTMLLDAIALVAYLVGDAKLALQGRAHRRIPYFTCDLWKYSVLRTRNRALLGTGTKVGQTIV
jgi:N-acetylglucosaminyl-diphospho-decaprenol L-rhamnosyltransferase